jgi:hypothetical protein
VPTYERFSRTEVLGRMALERMLAGLSTRRYRQDCRRRSRGRHRSSYRTRDMLTVFTARHMRSNSSLLVRASAKRSAETAIRSPAKS